MDKINQFLEIGDEVSAWSFRGKISGINLPTPSEHWITYEIDIPDGQKLHCVPRHWIQLERFAKPAPAEKYGPLTEADISRIVEAAVTKALKARDDALNKAAADKEIDRLFSLQLNESMSRMAARMRKMPDFAPRQARLVNERPRTWGQSQEHVEPNHDCPASARTSWRFDALSGTYR